MELQISKYIDLIRSIPLYSKLPIPYTQITKYPYLTKNILNPYFHIQ